MKVTITDVAKAANVSISTVSRVLNGNYPVSEELRTRVLKAVKELNFQPNALARSLKQQKTFLVGVVVADISNPFFMEIAKGIESAMHSEGYNLIFCSTDENPEKEVTLLRLLSERRVDAIILASCGNDPAHINQLVERGFPVVLIDRRVENCAAEVVAEDNFASSFKLVRHLIEKGHRKIGIVNGLLSVSSGRERFEGFKKALEHNNTPLEEKYVIQGNFRRRDAYEAVTAMIHDNGDDLPTALFVANNLMAEGTMAALRKCGLRIPEDISLVSFGSIRNHDLIDVRLTSISQNAFALGLKAGEIALKRIRTGPNGEVKEFIMVPEIIYGNSVKTLE